MAGESKTTTDHKVIKNWVEHRGGFPASVNQTRKGDDPGILRIEFPTHGDDSNLKSIPWDEFFDKFEKNKLAFLYQEVTADGKKSRFFKFIKR